jgi:hypothetical protein
VPIIQELEKTDRWTLHTAVELQGTLPWANNVMIRLKQEPHALNATRMGVGACLWEGELFLAAYLGEAFAFFKNLSIKCPGSSLSIV